MEHAPSATDVERRKQVRLRLRPDLSMSTQRYEGKTYYVVKDPVSLRYYRLDEKHSFLVNYLDGTHTLDDAQKEFEKRFRPDRLTLEELESFAQQLLTAGLAHNESPQAGKQLFERRRKRLRREWMQIVTNILYIKIPVFDPDKLLTKMLPYLRWIFTTTFFTLSVGVMLGAVLLVATHFETFRDKLPAYREFFSFRTLGYMWLALGVVKVIHEFGHGLSCKAFGGECHEMGALILCLSPALYCNVSDAWTLPSKWKRITISFAGIYVELIIAAIATFVWWNSPGEPFINNMSLSLMVVCSVSTVVFNGNPLMRYDGYYVLADWLEIPNLRDRANRFLKTMVLEHCLGIEVRPEPYMALGRRIWFLTFAIASYIYRWIVTFSILWFISRILEPYKLGAVSRLLAVAAAASLVGWPLYRLGESLYKRGRLPDMKQGRVWACIGAVAALLLFVFLMPLPVSRVRDLALVDMEPQAMQKVFVKEPGTLEVIRVRDGQVVQKGDLLADFRNIDLENQIGEAESEIRVREVELRGIRERLRSVVDAQDRSRMLMQQSAVQSELEDYRGRLKVYLERRDNMSLHAPCDGVVMSPPRQDDIGKFWEKDQQGTPFCTIGDPKRLRAIMPVSPADYRLMRDDLSASSKGALPATIRIQGMGGRTWQGEVSALPEAEAKEVPVQLTARLGGPLATRPDANPEKHVPQNQQYLVNVDFVGSDPSVCPGTMAQVKVHCRWQTCAWWLWRKVTGTFDLRLM